jgi:hypothetical protein
MERTAARRELGDAVRGLKDELDGDVIVSGCGGLARNLLKEGGRRRRGAFLGPSRGVG